MLNKDYKDILQNLLDADTRFLIIGAYAMSVYGYPRSTGDVDIWVDNSPDNSPKVFKALAAFGAPMADCDEQTFASEDAVFQIGVAPWRIDIITTIDGVIFQDAWNQKSIVKIDGLEIPFISKQDLIKNKRATGRTKDILVAVPPASSRHQTPKQSPRSTRY